MLFVLAQQYSKKKKTVGFYLTVVPTFILEYLRFHNYFRMSVTQLENLLILVDPDILKQNYIRELINIAEGNI